GRERPPVVAGGPRSRRDPVTIADVAGEIVLVDDLAHIAEDLGRGRDRRAGPRLEAIAEGVEIAVGADARIAVGRPRAAKALLFFEDDKAGSGALPGQVIGAADPGDPRPDDHDVEVLARQ